MISRGTVLLIDLDPTRGHERRGHRPCVVVSDPEVVAIDEGLALFLGLGDGV